jgi:hypothetical protein
VVDNRDFQMLAPLVRVNGAGKVPMPPRTVDYLVESKLVGSLEGQGGQDALKGLPIPIRITGPWHDISWQPDFQAALLGAAVDPSNLGEGLKGTVEGLGAALPGLGAATGGDTSGDSGSPESSGGVLGTLQQLTDPESAATEETTDKTTAEPTKKKKRKKKKKKKSIEEEKHRASALTRTVGQSPPPP